MKHKLYIVLLACIVNLSTLSCKKEQVAPSGYQGNGTGTNGDNNNSSQPTNLVANNWKSNQNGIWVHNFQNILSVNDAKDVKVYLLKDGVEIPINNSISFMNGTLWATYTTTDVDINFRFGGALP